jgi:hypothetical protein
MELLLIALVGSCLLGLIGLGGVLLLVKLGVIAHYWLKDETPDTIDAEYTLAQQEDEA